MLRLCYAHVYCSRRLYSAMNSGSDGINGRLPAHVLVLPTTEQAHSGLTITDPFVLYSNYVSQGILEKDEAQLRVMKEFQKLYFRLKDYVPPDEVGVRIRSLLRELEIKQAKHDYEQMQQGNETVIAKLQKYSGISSMFGIDLNKEKKQIMKVITDEEELMSIAAPHGLLLHGEVGCGKSMMFDIFATSLPHQSKMRWHYNNFILWVFNELHKLQTDRRKLKDLRTSLDHEFILFEIAQKLLNKSNVLLLDEFMLPDIASANIVKLLLTYYFKLGGVLVATLNKLPEELYSTEFHKSTFTNFVALLHTRCQTVDMRSDKDYRVAANKSSASVLRLVVGDSSRWSELLSTALPDRDQGSSRTVSVFNRTTKIPLTYSEGSICRLEFKYICEGLFSAADYISIASSYHTVILDNVPPLSTKNKNEARRFITLLDAIYEAKCQFYMHSEVPLLELFFADEAEKETAEEAGLAEMYSKTIMDIENPYRPNVSYYRGDNSEFKVEAASTTNFTNTSAFTGEDEKFAYKRAVLRILEMTGSDLWRRNQWVPNHDSMRPWETESHKQGRVVDDTARSSEWTGGSKRTDAPQIGEGHIWAMGNWTVLNGRRAKDSIAKRWLKSGMISENDK